MNGDNVNLSSERHGFDKFVGKPGTNGRNDAKREVTAKMSTAALIGSRRSRRRTIIKLSPYLVYVGLVGLSLGIVAALSVISLVV